MRAGMSPKKFGKIGAFNSERFKHPSFLLGSNGLISTLALTAARRGYYRYLHVPDTRKVKRNGNSYRYLYLLEEVSHLQHFQLYGRERDELHTVTGLGKGRN